MDDGNKTIYYNFQFFFTLFVISHAAEFVIILICNKR